MIGNYRRDGATKPLFRSRVSMMSSQPRQVEEADGAQHQDQTEDTRTTSCSFGATASSTSHRSRPRPRMWSSNSLLVSNKRSYSDTYYDDSSDSSDDSDSDDEEVLSHTINKNEIGRPTSPTSCTNFDRYRRHRKKRRTSSHNRRSSSSSSLTNERHVMFAANPVAEVRYRPRTPVDEKSKLFYSKRQIKDFRSAYYDWLEQGYTATDCYEMTDDEEDEEQEAAEHDTTMSSAPATDTAAPTEIDLRVTPTSGVVTPDVSSEEEDSDNDHDEEQ